MRGRFASGVGAGLVAYVLWGLAPLFWKSIHGVAPLDQTAHRVVWSLATVGAVVTVRRGWPRLAAVAADRRAVGLAVLSGWLLLANWLTFIWAVNNGHVVEGSLGYFINPLLNVVLGVAVLGERLPRLQWVAVGAATVGVTWMTVSTGRFPWVSLVLAGTFGVYGLIRKQSRLSSIDGLAVELVAMTPPAVVWLAVATSSSTLTADASRAGLLVATGVVTVLPLVFFAVAARDVPLSTLGLVQYVAPTLQFLIGVLVYAEPLSTGRVIGFCWIWAALAVFALDQVRSSRHGALATRQVGDAAPRDTIGVAASQLGGGQAP